MNSSRFLVRCALILASILATNFVLGGTATAQGDRVLSLKNGIQVEGKYATYEEYSEVSDKLPGGSSAIVMVDDGLRRTWFHRTNVVLNAELAKPNLKMDVYQDITDASQKRRVSASVVRIGPWDKYGVRRVTVRTSRGTQQIVQGIVEVTPTYCLVKDVKNDAVELRVATSTVPTDILVPLLRRQASDRNNINHRMEIVSLLIEAKRYWDANGELKVIAESFPDLTAELSEKRNLLIQQFARQVLREVELQRNTGQMDLATIWLEKIKSKDVADEISAQVFDIENEIKDEAATIQRISQSLLDLLGKLENSQALDQNLLADLTEIIKEITSNLNRNTINRMATFDRFLLDDTQTDQQKMSYAISGWLVGTAVATPNMAISSSLIKVRSLVREYLTTAGPGRRDAILRELTSLEGSDPGMLSKIIALLTPLNPPDLENYDPSKPIELEVEIQDPSVATGRRKVEYLVQLPPEYDPHRRYPCIVALHSEAQGPLDQIGWWCGSYNPRLRIRSGQAGRNGYIVVAPKWNLPKNRLYGFSGVEHLAVLRSLRDAQRRFSIDTDRVFLAGHFAGGDAAWDIGLSHPCHWAGVIPISGFAGPGSQYSSRCYENARNGNLAYYIVTGQNDIGRIVENKHVLNKWLARPDYDVMLIEYRGRLAENFPEEMPAIFDWMRLHERNFARENIEARTLRPWNNYFWWIELQQIPRNRVVLPEEWPPPKGSQRTVVVSCSLDRDKNEIVVRKLRDIDVNLWLLPELIDFKRPIHINGKGNDFKEEVVPSRRVILEDVRQRGDRQHPFWAELRCEGSKWRVANPDDVNTDD